jgi:hypothetical protein
MEINLLGGELTVNIYFEHDDEEFDDNICLSFIEPCPDESRIFRASETNIFITAQEARELAEILLKVAETSDLSSHDSV